MQTYAKTYLRAIYRFTPTLIDKYCQRFLPGDATVSRLSVRLSVRPSVTFKYVFHTGWSIPK